jgi:hypothetical protein
MRPRRGTLLVSAMLAAIAIAIVLPLTASAQLYLPLLLRNKEGGVVSPTKPPATAVVPTSTKAAPTATATATKVPTATATTAPPSVPAAPSGLAVQTLSSSRLALSWTDNSSNESGFQVERAPAGTSNYALVTVLGPDTTAYEDSGLTPNTTYSYRVRATGPGGYSGYSNSANGTTLAANTKPAAPTNLTAHNITDSSVYLTWTDNSNNETGFHLYLGIPETSYVTEIGAGVLLADYTSVTVIDLYSDHPYMFWVSAYNDAGESSWSNSVTIRTKAQVVTATRFCNYTSHPIISLEVDGFEYFPTSPLGILSGQCYDVHLTPGTHSFSAANGFWQSTYSRFEMYTWSSSFQQVAGQVGEISFNDPTIQQLLSNFGSVAYWHGMYWTYNPYATPHEAAYCFYSNGKYRFYVDGVQHSTGTYSLVQRGSLFTKFQTSASHVGMLYEAYGKFDMLQSPPGNQFTEYNLYPGNCPPTAP